LIPSVAQPKLQKKICFTVLFEISAQSTNAAHPSLPNLLAMPA
jgi:hypothetical protein